VHGLRRRQTRVVGAHTVVLVQHHALLLLSSLVSVCGLPSLAWVPGTVAARLPRLLPRCAQTVVCCHGVAQGCPVRAEKAALKRADGVGGQTRLLRCNEVKQNTMQPCSNQHTPMSAFSWHAQHAYEASKTAH
jgi:hypothetical protein